MARLTVRERREREAARRAEIERGRGYWFGHWVSFIGFDQLVKVGLVTEVNEQGIISVDYQLIPGCDDAPATAYITIGQEPDLAMRRLAGVPVEGAAAWVRELNYNDTILYAAAIPLGDGRHGYYQVRERGPYVGKVVDLVSWGVGVRADGWMGEAPLYYVYLADILGRV